MKPTPLIRRMQYFFIDRRMKKAGAGWVSVRTGPTDPQHAEALKRYYDATTWTDVDAMAATERAIEVLGGAPRFNANRQTTV